jgi:hypothetical protein
MGGISLVHTLIYLLILPIWSLIVGVPIAKILGRLGYSKVLVILAFLPLVNIVSLWMFANASWPNLNQRGTNA